MIDKSAFFCWSPLFKAIRTKLSHSEYSSGYQLFYRAPMRRCQTLITASWFSTQRRL